MSLAWQGSVTFRDPVTSSLKTSFQEKITLRNVTDISHSKQLSYTRSSKLTAKLRFGFRQKLRSLPRLLLSNLHSVTDAPWIEDLVLRYKPDGFSHLSRQNGSHFVVLLFFLRKTLGKQRGILYGYRGGECKPKINRTVISGAETDWGTTAMTVCTAPANFSRTM